MTVPDAPPRPSGGDLPPGQDAGRRPLRRALVSVWDKTGLEDLARGLHEAGVELVSTGSTAARIAGAGVPVTTVEEVTGFPECLDGRVKTLHPRVHAGILADLRRPDHEAQLADLGVEPFDLVVVNLYPFEQTVASGADVDECVEQVDIGGPSMVRAAAKNHPSVAVVTSPDAYAAVLAAAAGGGFALADRARLAAQAFAATAAYDAAVAAWTRDVLVPAAAGAQVSGEQVSGQQVPAEQTSDEEEPGDQAPPARLEQVWERTAVLRYGENPHQAAALYRPAGASGSISGSVSGSISGSVSGSISGLAGAEQLHGKEMSYNNWTDADAAWRAAHDHAQTCVAVVKHANPCGIAVADDVAAAHRAAHACDPVSAFGGVIAVNRPVSAAMAEQVAEVFTEVVVAPGYEDGALETLTRKKNVRLLRAAPPEAGDRLELKPVDGGLLVQTADRLQAPGDDPTTWTLVTGEGADDDVLADLAFAWRAVRAVRSNAVLLARGRATTGVGMGQVNRVDSARLAVVRAGDRAAGSVAASDAFFPFADGLQVLLDAGVRAVVQPGGSVRDEEVVAAARAAGATMYLTSTRHFTH